MEKKIVDAAIALKNGEVAIFPTETVYGLGASIFHPESVKKIFTLKGRPSDNPIIVHVSDMEQALSLVENPSESFFRLAERFWPGPLTLVVKKKEWVTGFVSGGLSTLAIRMPAHPIAKELIAAAGPLAAPSANLSGKPSPTCLQDALEDLGDKVRVSIDGGPCSIGIESTVVSLLRDFPMVLRPGHITRAQIEEELGCPTILPPIEGPILSPGMKYRHYAPKAPVRLVFDLKDLTGPTIIRTPRAETLYAELRRYDREGARQIEIYCDTSVRNDTALMDRLLRASSSIV